MADFIIIGGGVYGCGVAWELAKRGAEVYLLEAAADRPELISVDGIPIIDYLPGAENLLLAAGWSGHGWAIAPAVCQLLADWVHTGRQPDLLRPFGFRRFG